MSKSIPIILAIVFLVLTTGCSSLSDESYSPVIIDNSNLLPDSLKQSFHAIQFPKGVTPVLIVEKSVDDLLKIGAHTDDLFDSLKDQYEERNFGRFGVLIYITGTPQLMQVRMGSYYESFSNLCGVTTGYDYFTIQQLYANGSTKTALDKMLASISKNIEKRNNLNWWQRDQLSLVQFAINNFMGWLGSPSKTFYGTIVAKPTYYCISYGTKLFGSWFWGIVLVFAIILFARWLLWQMLKQIIPWQKLRYIVNNLFLTIVGYIYSLSTAGCAMLFSSGRLEDLYAIKAFRIPNVDSFIATPSMFVQESSFWMAGLFIFLTGITASLGYLTNEYVRISLLPFKDQMSIWNNISPDKQQTILGLNEVDEPIKDGETPFEAISIKLGEKLGEKLGGSLGSLAIASLFFFPKVVLWTGIAFNVSKILLKIPKLSKVLVTNNSFHKKGLALISVLMVIILSVTIIEIALGWIIDPFDRKENAQQEQVSTPMRQVEVITKTANLRIGPGTNYDVAAVNDDGTGGKWQVCQGDILNVVAEENDWYRITIGDNPREAYIKQSLCQDIVSTENAVNMISDDMNYDSSNISLLGSLPIGKSYFSGDMAGFPIELIITINDKSGTIKAVYKNVKYNATMNLEGESLPSMDGDISLFGKDSKNNGWSFYLTGNANKITGTACGDNKKLKLSLHKR